MKVLKANYKTYYLFFNYLMIERMNIPTVVNSIKVRKDGYCLYKTNETNHFSNTIGLFKGLRFWIFQKCSFFIGIRVKKLS